MTGSRNILLLVLLSAGLGLFFCHGGEMTGVDLFGRKDFRAFWSGARIWLDGGNPYDPVAARALQEASGILDSGPSYYVNPPYALVWLAPWGLLEYGTAQRLWFAANMVLAVGCLMVVSRLFARRIPLMEWFWLISFVPFLVVLQLGQMSLWITLFMLGAVWCHRAGRMFGAGFLLWLACIKPQMSFLLAGAMLLGALLRGQWKLPLGMLTGAVVSLVPWWWSGAPWIPATVMTEANPMAYYNSSLAAQALLLARHAGWEVPALVWCFPAVGAVLVAVWTWRAHRNGRGVSWRKLFALGPLFAPYVWSYDFVALAFAESGGASRSWVAHGLRLAIRVGAWVGLVWCPDLGTTFWVAPAMAGVIWWCSDGPKPGRPNAADRGDLFY